MENFKTKTLAISIVILLAISMSASIILMPTASAHTPPWTISTQAYVSTVPSTLGLGQNVFIVMWAYMKMPSSAITNNLRMQNYMLNVTTPDGKVTTLGPYTPDPTETTYTSYTPTQVGTYSLVFYYPNTVYIWNDTSDEQTWTNDIFPGSVSNTYNFTVVQNLVASLPNSYPLPTQYWNYPIEGQNTYWYTISSNWLGIGSPQLGTTGLGTVTSSSNVQPDGTGPTSAHVLWTKPLQDGGVVGGTNVGVPGNQFYTGQSYNQRFQNPIIMQGVLYYREPAFSAGGDTVGISGDTVAVNLRTGQEIWRRSNLPALSFGMTYDFETANQEGVIYNGILFSANFAQAFDPLTGNPMFNVTNVPGLTNVVSLPVSRSALFTSVTVPQASAALQPDGSILTYYVNNLGNASNQKWYLSEWNSSNLWTDPSYYPAIGSTRYGNVPVTPAMPTTAPAPGQAWNWNGTAWAQVASALATSTNPNFDWNVSMPFLTNNGQITEVLRANSGDMMLGVNGSIDQSNPGYIMWGGWNNGTTTPYTIWAINLNASRGAVGSLLWMQTYTAPSGFPNTPVLVWPETIDYNTRVFTMYDTYDMKTYGYSVDTGNQLWGPITSFASQPFNVFTGSVSTKNAGSHGVAYGNLYMSGYGGVVYAYNDTTGAQEWTYGNGGEGNSTQAGYSEPWGYFPVFIAATADGKLYVFNDEHSPTTPLYKGPEVRCLNATTGQEIWTLMSWDDGGQFVANGGAIADGEWVYDNVYDMQIYAIGQGPTAITATAPSTASTLGTPLVIRGTVTDISAGTQQEQQKANFPNGVPAVSDASQGDWIAHVYMQKPTPTNATGVPVQLYVLDSNNNYRQIGTATTDTSGLYTYTWTPDITGSYKLFAQFAGSNSYYPSSTETSFAVSAAPATPTPTPTVATSATDSYVIGTGIAIIAAIAIVGAILALMLRKRP
jgi:outer membrane protein assembly factor BamB